MFTRLYKKISSTKLFPYLTILILVFSTTYILWLPFILKLNNIYGISTPGISFQTILKHWDGLLYILPAKSLYNPEKMLVDGVAFVLSLPLSPKYFAAHLPLYPLTLKILSPFVGYPKATIVSTLISSLGLFSLFYFVTARFKLTSKPLLLTSVLMFFTPRFFITRSTPTPEPLFLLLIFASVYFFSQKKYLWAGVLGGLATFTKTPGILLFFAYSLYLFFYYMKKKRFKIGWLWIFLIPLSLLLIFTIYYVQYGDFFAYFNSGDNLHLIFPPFQVFNYQKAWVGTGWLEEIVFVYMFYLFAIVQLLPFLQINYSKIKGFFFNLIPRITNEDKIRFNQVSLYFMLLFFLSIISIQHRDISRYSLPMLPFALITLERFFTSKKFIVVLIILIPAIYIYSWNFMLINIAPISDWGPFL